MKKLLIILGAVVVLVGAAVIAASLLVPVQALTDRLAVAVKAATGRQFTIAGPVKLVLLPEIEVEASGVALANAPGAHDPDMVRLQKLDVSLKLLPLLTGSVEVGRLVLTGPQISLEIDKSGRPNWMFQPAPAAAPAAAGQPAPTATPAAAPASGGGPRPPPRIEELSLSDGSVTYRDDRAGTVETVSAIDLSLSQVDLSRPLSASGSAVYNGQKVTLDVAAAKPGALLAGGQSSVQLKVAANPVSAAFDGSLTGLPPIAMNGTIDLSVPSLRNLAQWAGTPLPPGPGFGKLAIKGRIERSGAKTSFEDAQIALDAMSGKGAFSLTTGGQRPLLSGQLAVDRLDLNPYLPPAAPAGKTGTGASAAGAGTSPPPAAAAQGWSDAPFDTTPLSLADADFALTANAIQYRKVALGQSALDLHLQDAKLSLTLSRMALYKGQGKGTLGLDASGAVPSLTANFSLDGVDIGPLLSAAADVNAITGTGHLDFAVQGQGRSQRALVATLAGKGALDLTNGELKGVDLVALASLGQAGAGSGTKFGSLSGTFTIANGIMHNNDLKLVTESAAANRLVPIGGTGTINLPQRTLDYHVNVKLAGALPIGLVVSGPWNDLSYRPDVTGALKGAVQAPGNILQQLPATGTGVLRNLFGK